jgi:uncharacterized protein YcsI (UPF0317 family)
MRKAVGESWGMPDTGDVPASHVAVAAPRLHSRRGHSGSTSGLAPGLAQASLVVLPADDALDFLRFYVRNPKSCPVLEVTDTGSPRPTSLAPDHPQGTLLDIVRSP